MIFQKEKQIRFSHCGPPGLGFYPRYVELVNEVVEDWFERGLEVSFHELHEKHRLGIPTVRLEVEYMIPSTYGDRLTFQLKVLRLGNSSMTFEVAALAADKMRLRAELTVVMMAMDTMRPVAIDDFWRPRLEKFLVTGDAA